MSLALLGNAVRGTRSAGRPLPTVWRTLEDATVSFRQPQLVLIGSGPGVGKSAFALNLAIRSGVSGIYFSADSGPATQLVRTVSLMTGRQTRDVQKALEQGHTFDDVISKASQIWWEFDAGPTLEAIEESVDAHGYLGAYPDLLIVDNLVNVDAQDDSGAEHKAFENVLLYLLELARSRGMCVIVLCHLTGEYEDGTTPPPLSALRGKVGKIPELVLNLYRASTEVDAAFGQERLGVAVVKNRDGMASAAGNFTVELEMDLSRMKIVDPTVPLAA